MLKVDDIRVISNEPNYNIEEILKSMDHSYENYVKLLDTHQCLTHAISQQNNSNISQEGETSDIFPHEEAYVNSVISSEILKVEEKFSILKKLLRTEYHNNPSDKKKYRLI